MVGAEKLKDRRLKLVLQVIRITFTRTEQS